MLKYVLLPVLFQFLTRDISNFNTFLAEFKKPTCAKWVECEFYREEIWVLFYSLPLILSICADFESFYESMVIQPAYSSSAFVNSVSHSFTRWFRIRAKFIKVLESERNETWIYFGSLMFYLPLLLLLCSVLIQGGHLVSILMAPITQIQCSLDIHPGRDISQKLFGYNKS